MNKLKQLFERRIFKYGAGIFKQQTWLDKQVQEALYKRTQADSVIELGEVKEQK